MKFFLPLIFTTLILSLVQAQQESLKQADSLKYQLSIAKEDTTRVLILAQLDEAYRSAKPDSALLYGQQALSLARQIRFQRGEVHALLGISVVQRELGNLPYALDVAFKGLQIAQANHYVREKFNCLLRIANVYAFSKNFDKALVYYRLAKQSLKTISDDFLLAIVQMFMGDVYEQTNKLDSALYYVNSSSYYLQLTFNKNTQFKDATLQQNIFRLLGNIQAKSGNNGLALKYYQQGIQTALKTGDYRTASTIYTNVASLYKKMNQPDSAIYYAKQGLAYGQSLAYESRILIASSLLAELYEQKDAREALRYYKIAATAKDNLYGAEKVQKLQTMTLDEQERQQKVEADKINYQNKVRQYALFAGLAVFLIIALILYRSNRNKQKANALLQNQRDEIDRQKSKLQQSLDNLKSAQAQLIQSEKMASLGELTAGIAHEIQNPLNFVNNFSEVNSELIAEMKEEIDKGNVEEVRAIANDIADNEQKINHHGKRADAIVKGMLQHSRASSGQKELTDINVLADEYLRLAYHGLRAKDKIFDATLQIDFDKNIRKLNVVPQDIGRVLLNLYNNAFYAVNEKSKQQNENYEPTVSVSTKKINDKIEIRVKDNGNGIPQKVVDKIFQPFFTTKPTGQGTGLGLSLSYDIIKAHGGEIKVETQEGEGAEFVIQLPTNNKMP
jgi:two-component system NtrC family sensor kinase